MRALAIITLLFSLDVYADEAAVNAALAAKFGTLAEHEAKVRANPKLMRLALSGRLCGFQNWRVSTMAEISKQKHYSSIGGAVDLRIMHALQQRLRALDESITADRAELKQVKQRPYTCASGEVTAVLACVDSATWPECNQEPLATVVGIINEHDADIPGSELINDE